MKYEWFINKQPDAHPTPSTFVCLVEGCSCFIPPWNLCLYRHRSFCMHLVKWSWVVLCYLSLSPWYFFCISCFLSDDKCASKKNVIGSIMSNKLEFAHLEIKNDLYKVTAFSNSKWTHVACTQDICCFLMMEFKESLWRFLLQGCYKLTHSHNIWQV